MGKRYPQASPLLEELASAIDARQLKRLQSVLKKGADVNAKLNGFDGPKSPFQRAVGAGSDEVALALLDAGAMLERGDLNLVWAARTGRPDVVRKFLAMGADPDVKTMLGTPINVAAKQGDVEIVRLLIDAGADVNAGSRVGTPLQRAAEQGHTDVALALLEAGASLQPVPGTESAVQLAKANGNARLVEALNAARAEGKKPARSRGKEPSRAAGESVKAMIASPWSSAQGVPDFTARARRPAYVKAVEALAALCGTRPQPMSHAVGGFTFHLHSRKAKAFDLLRVHRDFLARSDCYVYATESNGGTIAILPTTDVGEVVQTMATNGNNYGVGPGEVIAWARKTARAQPIAFTGIGFDFLEGWFTDDVNEPAKLAEEIVNICPDEEVPDDVAHRLRKSRRLFLWWD
jgi:ankyrin repeat protein